MNKKTLAVIVVTGAAAVVGFAVGFGIGKETRAAANSNVDASYNDGIVTIKADIATALKTGVMRQSSLPLAQTACRCARPPCCMASALSTT